MKLPEPTTSYVDTYCFWNGELTLAASSHDCAREVTRITVEINTAAPDEKDCDPIYVNVDLYGYPLTKAGKRSERQQHGRFYGKHDDKARWDLELAVTLASLTRHGIDPAQAPEALRTWEDYQADKMRRYGWTPDPT